MPKIKFPIFAFLAASTLFLSSALAQSDPLANLLTGSDAIAELGSAIAISGDTIVTSGFYYGTDDDYLLSFYVFERSFGGWGQTAKLTLSDGGSAGGPVAICGDTIFVTGPSGLYIFVKPVGGWKDMAETARVNIGNGYAQLAVDGDTLVVNVGSSSTAYVFVKPTGGWAATSTYQAKLIRPADSIPLGLGVSGDTVVWGSHVAVGNGVFKGSVNVFQKPKGGWAGEIQPSATLTRSIVDPDDNEFGNQVAISGETIAVSAPYATVGNGAYEGVVDLFVRPATGWADVTETVELVQPTAMQRSKYFGNSIAMDSSHLLVGSGYETFASSDTAFVYSRPAAGWGSFEWPSQKFVGIARSGYGEAVALDGDTTAIGAPNEITGGANSGVKDGAAYAYTLEPNPILVSTDFMEFPDSAVGSSEKLLLTVTNAGAKTLSFTTYIDVPNYQVLQTEENTCLGGVPAGQSCVLPIEFNPPAVGVHTNHLTLASSETGALRIVTMRGLARGVGAPSEAPLNAYATVGKTVTVPLVLANFGVPGSPTVALSFSDPSWSLHSMGTCASGVPEGGTCTVNLHFSPVTSGYQYDSLTVTPSSGAGSKVVLLGYGYSAN